MAIIIKNGRFQDIVRIRANDFLDAQRKSQAYEQHLEEKETDTARAILFDSDDLKIIDKLYY